MCCYNFCNRSAVLCYDYIQACVLHLMDIDWQPYDLNYIDHINLPEFYILMAKGNQSLIIAFLVIDDSDILLCTISVLLQMQYHYFKTKQ